MSRISFGLNRGMRDHEEKVRSPGMLMLIRAERRLTTIPEVVLPPILSGRLVEIGGLNLPWMMELSVKLTPEEGESLLSLILSDLAEDPSEEPSDRTPAFW